MHKRNLLLMAAFLLATWSVAGLADEGGAFVEGEAAVGAHNVNTQDNPQRVGEYVSPWDIKTLVADMYLDLFGGSRSTLYNVQFLYRDSSTKSFDFGLDTGNLVSAEAGYGSFVHNLDHDLLQNMQGKSGGKQVYHTDNDPLGRYYLEYQDFHAGVTVDLPFLENGQIYGKYHDRQKTGYKQTMTIDHCSFCHVESHSQRVDQQTETWTAGISGSVDRLSLGYELVDTRFREGVNSDSRLWGSARHPVNGLPYDFASREIFSDVVMPYQRSGNNDKISHSGSLKLDLEAKGTVKGSYTHTKRTSYWTGIESKFDAGALGYAVKLNQDMRVTAKFLTYETKVDDYFVDLPSFRAGDAVAGNLDFDWTRISSANRQVTQLDLDYGWRPAKGHNVRLSWRSQVVDRDAMAQNQTSYLFDGVNDGNAGIVETKASEAFANKTKLNRLKLRYDARLGRKGNVNVTAQLKSIDQPYMNPTAMCEESLEGVNSAHVTAGTIGRIYYFQRERYGMGSSLPSSALSVAARGSYQLAPRLSLNAYLTVASEKNDELNIYEFQRDVFTPGVNLWTAPSDRLLLTLGWNHSKVESNANLCPPIFDG